MPGARCCGADRSGRGWRRRGRPPGRWGSSRGDLALAGTPTRALARDHDALHEELTAPDAPRLAALEGAVEAGVTHGAVGAQSLGVLHVGRGLGEPELCVVRATGNGCRLCSVVEGRSSSAVSCM